MVTPQFVLNRCNPKIHKAGSYLFGTDKVTIFICFDFVVCILLKASLKLLTNIDRYGIFRPTINHPEWSTTKNVHLDMNPVYWATSKDKGASDQKILEGLSYKAKMDFIVENNCVGTVDDGKLHVQGLINLLDNREQDGGFLVCPGVHKHLYDYTMKCKLEEYSNLYGKDCHGFCVLPKDDHIFQVHAIRVTARAGSLVLWNQRLPHGSAPNFSERFRYAQFLKMFPKSYCSDARLKKRSEAVKKLLQNADIEIENLPSLAKEMYGLEKED